MQFGRRRADTYHVALRVFLCDDSPGFRALVRAVLNGDVEVVGEAGDGRTGVEGVAATAPDVLVLDLRMPGVDGFAALDAVSELPSPPRVLVVSATPQDEAAGRLHGVDFLPKGASHDELREAVLGAAA
jgi:DNA-binding NarL/FixJ family response regulator